MPIKAICDFQNANIQMVLENQSTNQKGSANLKWLFVIVFINIWPPTKKHRTASVVILGSTPGMTPNMIPNIIQAMLAGRTKRSISQLFHLHLELLTDKIIFRKPLMLICASEHPIQSREALHLTCCCNWNVIRFVFPWLRNHANWMAPPRGESVTAMKIPRRLTMQRGTGHD